MRILGRKRSEPIRVKLHVRALVGGRMMRVAVDATACKDDRLADLLKQLRRAGTVDRSIVRSVLKGDPGVMVLRNGELLAMPAGTRQVLADGDELSIMTPMAGG